MTLRPLALLALLASCALVLPAGASAAKSIKVAVGDQSTAMFADANWKRLKLKRTRYFVPWNAISNERQLQLVDNYVAAARKAKVEVLLHVSTDDFTPKKAKLPSTSQYRKSVGALVKRFKGKVKVWGVWNEMNHNTQPTFRSPKRAAQFYGIMRSVCKRCTIVAADLLDQPGTSKVSDVGYLKLFWKALKPADRKAVRVIGFHNYSETNRDWRPGKDRKSTPRLIKELRKLTKKADLWLTETGGVVKLTDKNDGKGIFGCNPLSSASIKKQEAAQAKSVKYVLTLAKRNKSTVSRVYLYNWFGSACKDRFDAGLVRSAVDATARPAYRSLRAGLRAFGK